MRQESGQCAIIILKLLQRQAQRGKVDMTALRQQAYDLLDAMPDGDLCLVVDILEALKRNKTNPRSVKPRKTFDFSKYMGLGEKMFANTEEIDNYLKESRSDRFYVFDK